MPKHPDAVFNGANNFAQLAEQIRELEPRALTPAAYDDVLTCIEYLQDETIKRYDHTIARENDLNEREARLEQRERDLTIQKRAVEAVLRNAQPKPSRRLVRFFS